ncbi:COG1470 family protein [Microbacterium sp. gxy059]|uniref:COG1470 family protein n=1 Tax=Microbacterium sp. gxy059 TaxID=2957199 RepID=UPI003D98BC9B
MFRLWIALVAAAGLTLLGASSGAVAAAPDEAITWSVVPADDQGPDGRSAVEAELSPGESATEHLAVRNLGEAEATFRLGAADGYYTEKGRFTTLPAGRESEGAGTWVRLPAEVRVEPGETAVVPVEIVVPDQVAPGDHAAGVFASVESAGQTGSSAIGVESRVGFRLLVRVDGELAPALTIDEAGADYAAQGNPFRPGALSAEYTVTNTGNVALALTDEIGGKAGARGDLLPGETRTVRTDPAPAWPLFVAGDALVVHGVAPGDDALSTSAEVRVSTWALPWPQLLLLGGVGLVLAAVLGGRRRSATRLQKAVEAAREEGRREGAAAAPSPAS